MTRSSFHRGSFDKEPNPNVSDEYNECYAYLGGVGGLEVEKSVEVNRQCRSETCSRLGVLILIVKVAKM